MNSFLRHHRPVLITLAVSLIVGIVAAGWNAGMLPLPGAEKVPPQAVARTHIQIDAKDPPVVQREVLGQDLQTLIKHGALLSGVMTTEPVIEKIARRADVPPELVSASARTTDLIPQAIAEPAALKRASDAQQVTFPYRFEAQARSTSPIIDIYAVAPTPDEAGRLANATVTGLQDYLDAMAAQQRFPAGELAVLRQLGTAQGRPIQSKSPLIIAVLTFITVAGITAGLLWAVVTLRRRRAGVPPRERPAPRGGGDWPHTTRVLPWMLAVFIALLWFAPFNQIELGVSAPIDLKLDRLVLPFLVIAWLLAFMAGRAFAPQLRWTAIHTAVAVFLGVAFLSVILNARALDSSLELDLPIKQLPLLIFFVSLFVITATGVRRTEVRPFMFYTLLLGVTCAFGVIIEFRFKQNLFFKFADMALPPIFHVDAVDPYETDGLGRRLVRGPADVPLETVTMLSLAFPVALVGLMQSDRWRSRLLYGLAACILVAGMFATYRKSALLAPVSIFVTLAYFRRRELLKLAPLGLVLLIVVSALSPGALGSTISQFTRSDAADVPTVSDRVSDYDAIRPDVLSHLAFGRGWGAYKAYDYRVLDSEILHRLVEMGVIGLLAFLAMPITAVLASRHVIRARDHDNAPMALAGAAGAVSFIVASTLYDVMSFPHAAYIFLYVAGLTAVAIAGPRPAEPAEEQVEPQPEAEAPPQAAEPVLARR
ncbi:O-antigen ligase [Solirubrobacter pauli]|uniref:O-antigen ligase n=1 Tax=Solirubrobacter pauli TaxID=166793 RepID=A0A660LIG5_9ACTN|nr:O-antigen ligase family protein [Solirubrobacter pauli]RKQ94095.1 O-antigen ligase [Solirubrobacter pauli]